ncbi:MAG TPA: TnsA endonuclease N-terminal domain-containing protein [Allosphingosinicella sp.]
MVSEPFAWPTGIEISNRPLRKVVRRSCAHTNGTSRTYKHPEHELTFIQGDSIHELLFLAFAEIDPNVTAIAAQPTQIVAHLNGKPFSHIPDFAVVVAGAGEIVEVKPDRAYADLTLRRRLAAAAEFVDSTGWTYRVALAGDLHQHPLREQVDDLWRRHRRTYTDLQKMAVHEAVGFGEKPVADVQRQTAGRLGASAPSLEHILSMAANAQIFIDLSRPIGEHSLVRYPDRQAMPPILLPRRRPIQDLPAQEAA